MVLTCDGYRGSVPWFIVPCDAPFIASAAIGLFLTGANVPAGYFAGSHVPSQICRIPAYSRTGLSGLHCPLWQVNVV